MYNKIYKDQIKLLSFDFSGSHVSSGHTLLAVRAPSGTQLDVPIPKAVSPALLEPTALSSFLLPIRWDDLVCACIFFQVQDSPAKYQIHLKSVRGPIDVLLLNKHSASSVPVVLPVPPPEEILRDAKLAMSTSDATESSTATCQASADTKHCTKSRQTAMEDMQPPHASSFINTEPNRTDAPKCEYFSLCGL